MQQLLAGCFFNAHTNTPRTAYELRQRRGSKGSMNEAKGKHTRNKRKQQLHIINIPNATA